MNNPGSDTGHPPVKPRSKAPLPPSDGRSSEARRYKALVDSITSYLDHRPTKAETALAERAAALSIRLDVINAKLMAGEPVNIREQLSIGKAMQSALDALGILPLKPKERRWR